MRKSEEVDIVAVDWLWVQAKNVRQVFGCTCDNFPRRFCTNTYEGKQWSKMTNDGCAVTGATNK